MCRAQLLLCFDCCLNQESFLTPPDSQIHSHPRSLISLTCFNLIKCECSGDFQECLIIESNQSSVHQGSTLDRISQFRRMRNPNSLNIALSILANPLLDLE